MRGYSTWFQRFCEDDWLNCMRQVALLDRMERLVHLSPDAQQVRDSCDEMFAIVAAKIDMAQRVQQHLFTFRSRD